MARKTQTKRPRPRQDPMREVNEAIEEIRETRRKLWRAGGGTARGVIEYAKREGLISAATAPKSKRRKSA